MPSARRLRNSGCQLLLTAMAHQIMNVDQKRKELQKELEILLERKIAAEAHLRSLEENAQQIQYGLSILDELDNSSAPT